MKYLLPILLLAGCSSIKQPTTVSMPWPEVPTGLMEQCPDLKPVDAKTEKLSDVLDVVTANYSDYYVCAGKIDDWNQWYNTQKRIYESTRK